MRLLVVNEGGAGIRKEVVNERESARKPRVTLLADSRKRILEGGNKVDT